MSSVVGERVPGSERRADHPEVDKHRKQLARAANFRRTVAEWAASEQPLVGGDGDQWRAADLRGLLGELINLLEAYNGVLWKAFPYCRDCLGGCCVVDATALQTIDYVALALLEESIPQRPARSPVGEQACIYLTPTGCSWPQRWRPLKCALFYCLGSGEWELDAGDARYEALTAALAKVVRSHLPDALRDEEERLLALLPDPVAFATALGETLDRLVLDPFLSRYPQLALPENGEGASGQADERDKAIAQAMIFIAEAAEQVTNLEKESAPDGMVEQHLLADLEQLEWIVLARPSDGAEQLARLQARYQPQGGDVGGAYEPLVRQMARIVGDLQATWSNENDDT